MAAQVTFLSYLWLRILMDTFLDCPEIMLKQNHIVNEKSRVKQKRPLGFKKKKIGFWEDTSFLLAMNSLYSRNHKKRRRKKSIKFVEKNMAYADKGSKRYLECLFCCVVVSAEGPSHRFLYLRF